MHVRGVFSFQTEFRRVFRFCFPVWWDFTVACSGSRNFCDGADHLYYIYILLNFNSLVVLMGNNGSVVVFSAQDTVGKTRVEWQCSSLQGECLAYTLMKFIKQHLAFFAILTTTFEVLVEWWRQFLSSSDRYEMSNQMWLITSYERVPLMFHNCKLPQINYIHHMQHSDMSTCLLQHPHSL